MLAASMVMVVVESVGSSAISRAPAKEPKRPFTLATMRCLMVNSILVWSGSMAHVPATGNSTPFQVRVVLVMVASMVSSTDGSVELLACAIILPQDARSCTCRFWA